MKFDEVLRHLGEFGRYQKRLFYPLCITAVFNSITSFSVLFLLDIPYHRCSLGENDTYRIQDEHHAHLVNMSIPWETYRGKPVLSSCYMYTTTNNGSFITNETKKCHSWVFDKSNYESTLTEKFGFVCDDRILRSHSNMASFVGQTFATIFVGLLADIFGRRPAFLIHAVIQAASCICIVFVPNAYVFMFLRAIANVALLAVGQTSFVLVMEICGPSKRVFVGVTLRITRCIGLFMLGAAAYFLRNWMYLQLTISMPMVLYVGFFWLVPESPRWLISRQRIPQAQKIIQKMARVNKVELLPEVEDNVQFNEKTKTKTSVLTKWFTSRSLFVMTLIIFFNWFVISMVYYGLGLNVQNLSGDIYLNFTIANIMELASYLVCLFLMDRLGRKILHCVCMLVGGLACIASILPVLYGTLAMDWVTVLFAMVGKFGASGALAIIYVYTAELFPTVIRSSGVGLSSFFGRIGALLSPYVSDLGILIGGNMKVALPLVVFGAFSVTAGLLALTLPETLGKKLPETIEDSKSIKRSVSMKSNNISRIQNPQTSDIIELNTMKPDDDVDNDS